MHWQASREHYCINKQVMKKPNKDEECNNLIGADGAGCQYFKNTAQRMYGQQSSLALQVETWKPLIVTYSAQSTHKFVMFKQFFGHEL